MIVLLCLNVFGVVTFCQRQWTASDKTVVQINKRVVSEDRIFHYLHLLIVGVTPGQCSSYGASSRTWAGKGEIITRV